MTSFSSVGRQTAIALLVTAAACGDNITQSKAPAKQEVAEAVSTTTPSGPTPALLAVATVGSSADFASMPDLRPPSRPGLFYRVEIDGMDFPLGLDRIGHFVGVTPDGSKHAITTAITVAALSTTYKATWSASCPSGYQEMYFAVTSAGRTTESNRVATGC